jgi:hypothetical protein
MATVTCPGCLERDAEVAGLKRRVAELETRLQELQVRLATNATNSGTPPSANPPDAPRLPRRSPADASPAGNRGTPPTSNAVCPRTRHPRRHLRPHPLRPLPRAPAAAAGPRRPAADLAPGRRAAAGRRRGRRVPGALPHLPMLRAPQPRSLSGRYQGAQRRPAAGRHLGLPGRLPPHQQARPGGDRRSGLRGARGPGDGQPPRSADERGPGRPPRRGVGGRPRRPGQARR